METEMVSQLIDQFGMDVMRFCRKLTFAAKTPRTCISRPS